LNTLCGINAAAVSVRLFTKMFVAFNNNFIGSLQRSKVRNGREVV
jgi:hypothetical protein